MEELKNGVDLPSVIVKQYNAGSTMPEDLDVILYEPHIQGTLNIFLENWETITEKVTRNCIAASSITHITNDEEDARAEKMLAATRATYKVVEKLTAEITGPLDEFRDKLIAPKKKISTLQADINSEFNRIKSLRDRYMSAKHAKNKTLIQDVEKTRLEKEEYINLQVKLIELITNFVSDKLEKLDSAVQTVFDNVTLETLPQLEQRMNSFKPSLQPEAVNAIFVDLIPDHNKMSESTFQEVYLPQFKADFTYEKILDLYAPRALESIADWKVKIATLRSEMEGLIAALDADDKNKADEILKTSQERIEKEKKEKEEEFARVKEAARIEAEKKANAAHLNNSFAATAQLQQTAEQVKGQVVREVDITCPPEKIVEVFAKILFACFNSPKFEGWCKLGLDGKPVRDEDGIPLYTPWAEQLVKFYAKNCASAIQYVEIKERVSTRARK